MRRLRSLHTQLHTCIAVSTLLHPCGASPALLRFPSWGPVKHLPHAKPAGVPSWGPASLPHCTCARVLPTTALRTRTWSGTRAAPPDGTWPLTFCRVASLDRSPFPTPPPPAAAGQHPSPPCAAPPPLHTATPRASSVSTELLPGNYSSLWPPRSPDVPHWGL